MSWHEFISSSSEYIIVSSQPIGLQIEYNLADVVVYYQRVYLSNLEEFPSILFEQARPQARQFNRASSERIASDTATCLQ